MQSEREVIQRMSFGRCYCYLLTLSGQQVEEVVREANALYGHFYENVASQLVGLQRHLYRIASPSHACLYISLRQLLVFRISEVKDVIGERCSVLCLQREVKQ